MERIVTATSDIAERDLVLVDQRTNEASPAPKGPTRKVEPGGHLVGTALEPIQQGQRGRVSVKED